MARLSDGSPFSHLASKRRESTDPMYITNAVSPFILISIPSATRIVLREYHCCALATGHKSNDSLTLSVSAAVDETTQMV